LRKEASSKAYYPCEVLTGSEERVLNKAIAEDVKTLDIGVDVLKDSYKKAKSSDITHENEIKEYQNKLKSIIGSNDLTN